MDDCSPSPSSFQPISSPISRLPHELLLHILDLSASLEPIAELVNNKLRQSRLFCWTAFSLVGKAWHAVAHLEVWRTVKMDLTAAIPSSHKPVELQAFTPEIPIRQSLFEALTSQPHLAALVRSLYVRDFARSFKSQAVEATIFVHLLDHLPNLDEVTFPRIYGSAHIQEQIVLRLAGQRPHFHRLTVSQGPRPPRAIFSSFDNLETLNLESDHVESPLRLSTLSAPNFRLRTLSITSGLFTGLFTFLTSSSVSSLTSLTLSLATLDTSYDLSHFLAIRTLSLRVLHSVWNDGRFADFSSQPDDDDEDEPADPFLLSLRPTLLSAASLPGLEALSLTIFTLWGYDHDPSPFEAALLLHSANLFSALPLSLGFLDLNDLPFLASDVKALLSSERDNPRFIRLGAAVEEEAQLCAGRAEEERLEEIARGMRKIVSWSRPEYVRRDEVRRREEEE